MKISAAYAEHIQGKEIRLPRGRKNAGALIVVPCLMELEGADHCADCADGNQITAGLSGQDCHIDDVNNRVDSYDDSAGAALSEMQTESEPENKRNVD